jgi:hypothetical protein
VIACAQPNPTAENIELADRLSKGIIDWRYLIRCAKRHRLMPLLFHSLKKKMWGGIPDAIAEELENSYLFNAVKNRIMTDRLLEILSIFDIRGIAAIPFKGPLLSAKLYGDTTFRQFSDLDILVKKEDIRHARRLMLEAGYADGSQLDEGQFLTFARNNRQSAFVHHRTGVAIELHWEISNGYLSVDLDYQSLRKLWSPVEFEGHEVRHLTADMLLVYLCLHGAKDAWPNLEMIHCVAEFTRSHREIDWHHVLDLAERFRCPKALSLGLFLAQDLFGINAPAWISAMIADHSETAKLAAEVHRSLFCEQKLSDMAANLKRLRFHMNLKSGFPEKIRYCLRVFMVPKAIDWKIFPLPASMSFLHYVLRPIRLAYKWAAYTASMAIHPKTA